MRRERRALDTSDDGDRRDASRTALKPDRPRAWHCATVERRFAGRSPGSPVLIARLPVITTVACRTIRTDLPLRGQPRHVAPRSRVFTAFPFNPPREKRVADTCDAHSSALRAVTAGARAVMAVCTALL
jgi:hypothetical protein